MGHIVSLQGHVHQQTKEREFESGYAAGVETRDRNESPSIYIRVARDRYAEGFRNGFFSRPVTDPAVIRRRR